MKRGKKSLQKKINWEVFIVSLIVVFFVAGIGSYFVGNNANSMWYSSIKPSITPPNWVFPIVWNVIFILIAYSLYFSWIKTNGKRKKRELIIVLFGVNFLLNILWSFLFFTSKNPLAALIELFFLWLSILVLIFEMYEINKISGYLLIPYAVWVTFAGYLNLLSYLSSGLF